MTMEQCSFTKMNMTTREAKIRPINHFQSLVCKSQLTMTLILLIHCSSQTLKSKSGFLSKINLKSIAIQIE
jgi:hypothetical protein